MKATHIIRGNSRTFCGLPASRVSALHPRYFALATVHRPCKRCVESSRKVAA